ncbi:uncharacterized protein [Paramormyrops kingsleyae]|uniref:Plectin-like n=1 Tax=Paramormyrops kingsleyae TaxID=1676925 RepID=A0A3B3QUZ0_9TELE|nr:plectin-like [Paramormyrops kingsleyae]
MQKAASEEELVRLKGTVLELEAVLAERQQRLEHLEGELEAHRRTIDDLTLQKSKAEYEVKQYRSELEGVVKGKAAAELELSRARQLVQQSEAKHSALESSLKLLKSNIEESTLLRRKLEKHLRRKDSDVQDLEEHKRTLERELRAKENTEAELMDLVRGMEVNLALKSESRESSSDLHMSVVRETVHQCSFASANLLGSDMTLQHKIEELAMGKKRAESEVKTLKSELNSVLVQKTMAEEKVQRFKELLDDANGRLKKLQMEMDSERSSNRQRLEELRQEVTELKKSVYVFQEQVKSLQREKSSLEQKAIFHKTEVEGLKEQLKINHGKLVQKSSLEQEINHKMRCLEDELCTKQADGDCLRFKVNELTRNNAKLDNDLRNLKVAIETLQQEKAYAEQKLKTRKEEVEGLKELLQKTKEDFNLKTKSDQEIQLKARNLEMELEKNSQVVVQLRKKVDELKKINLESERSMKNLKSELDKVSMEMGSKDQHINIYKSQAESTKTQVKIIEDELLKKTQALHELQIKLRDYNEEVRKTSELQQKNNALSLSIANYENEITNLKSEINSVSIEKKMADKSVQEQKIEISDLNLTLRKAKEEIQKESTEVRKYFSKVKELESELLKYKQTIKEMTGNTDSITSDLKKDIGLLQKDKAAADKTLITLKAELDAVKASLRRTTEELQKETQEGRMNQSKIKELEGELQRNRLKMKEMTSSSEKFSTNFKQEILVLQRERSAVEEKSRALTLEVSLLRQKLEKAQEEVRQKQKECSAAQLRSQKLEEQLENCKRMLDDLKGKLDLQKNAYGRHLEIFQQEMEQKLLLKESDAKFEYDKKSREHMYNTETAEKEKKYLRQEIEQLKTLNESTQKSKQETEQQINTLHSKVSQVEKEKNVINQELIHAKTRITELETENTKLTVSISKMDSIQNVSSKDNQRLKEMLSETEQKLAVREVEARSLKEQNVSYVKEVQGLQEKVLKLEVSTSESRKIKDMDGRSNKFHQCMNDDEITKLKNELQVAKRMLLSHEEIKGKQEEELRKVKIATTEKKRVNDKPVMTDDKTNIYNQKKIHNVSQHVSEQGHYAVTGSSTCAEVPAEKGQPCKSNSILADVKVHLVSPNVKDIKGLDVRPAHLMDSIQLHTLRGHVSIQQLVALKLLESDTIQQLQSGHKTLEEVQDSLAKFTSKSSAIAGVYLESSKKKISFMEAAEKGFIAKTYAIEFVEAQAATGCIIDQVTGKAYSVLEALDKGIVLRELKDKLLDAEKAISGYVHGGKVLSVFQAMEERIVDRHKGRKILEAQIATGGLIDPQSGIRLPLNIAVEQGFINKATLQSLYEPVSNPKGFHNPDTGQKAYYCELLRTCVFDVDGRVLLLPVGDRHLSNITLTRTHRISVINSCYGAEMSTYEAYVDKHIDRKTYLLLSQQETDWKESSVMDSSGGMLHILTDYKSGRQFCIEHSLTLKMLDKAELGKYRSGLLSINELVDILISRKTIYEDPHSPIAGLWDFSLKSRVSIYKGLQQNLLDRLTAVRLLEAQVCTGGICEPSTGEKMKVAEAVRRGLLDEALARQLLQFEQACSGIVHSQTSKILSVTQAMQQNLLPRDIGFRCLEYQFLTGGLIHPQTQVRVKMEEAIQSGLVEEAVFLQLKDEKSYTKNLSCPKTKRKMSFKDALEKAIFDRHTGLKLLEATKLQSVGASSSFHYIWMY